ncbi:hypothetical protein SAMN05216206_1943 [Pseudomonas guineae]|uniref:Uncharacterized protein n=1 Tax=Pseudomonas guineae TaxID=425504 RepID=A0A1I3HF40_9PSED|nr:hypothetical protein [Pseudomonas guineae]SFI34283.1 hypothetical protein SAMN05216206_1943 [Pseudomonas guineae]
MRPLFLIAVSITAAACTQSASAEYITKSHFTKNYKCIVKESGGYNHTQSGHQLTKFIDRNEFFLTHISRLPLRSVSQMRNPSIVGAFNGNEALIRADAEEAFSEFTNAQASGYRIESGTYYLRDSTRDPMLSPDVLSTCEAFGKEGELQQISCDRIMSKFDFIPNTGRFMVTTEGNWTTYENGTPDSSVFEFGTCKEYYD